MKKLFVLTLLIFLLTSLKSMASIGPIYINVKFGFFAKWEIVNGQCHPGWGICISTPITIDNNAFIGYTSEDATSIYLKVLISSEDAKYFASGKIEIKEDSPIDPILIKQFKDFKNPKGLVAVIKKGIYPVKTEGDYYVVAAKYYLQ